MRLVLKVCSILHCVIAYNLNLVTDPFPRLRLNFVSRLLFAGAILESTGSYVGPFVVSGMLFLLGGLLCLPARRIAAWENARNERRLYKPVKKAEEA